MDELGAVDELGGIAGGDNFGAIDADLGTFGILVGLTFGGDPIFAFGAVGFLNIFLILLSAPKPTPKPAPFNSQPPSFLNNPSPLLPAFSSLSSSLF